MDMLSDSLVPGLALRDDTESHAVFGSRFLWAKLAALHRRAASSPGAAQADQGIGIIGFLTALVVAIIVFTVQVTLFLLLRNKLARIFKPKTYLVPERERTDPPPAGLFSLFITLFKYSDREVIKKCGLDAYFFLRYLRTLLVIFTPITLVVLPVLVPLNYVGGKGQNIEGDASSSSHSNSTVEGLDTLAWGNIKSTHTKRYDAHLLMAILVVIWVCTVFFFELRVYIKIRQDYLTSAEHRLRASATTVLVNSIPAKWLSEDALRGLFDVFPGGVRNIWLNRDLTALLDKIDQRDDVHQKLEQAETDLIKAAKQAQVKKKKAEDKKNKQRISKDQQAARNAEKDAKAREIASSGGGVTAGDTNATPNLEESLEHELRLATPDAQSTRRRRGTGETHTTRHRRGTGETQATHPQRDHEAHKTAFLGVPMVKLGTGAKDVVHKAGNGVENIFETTDGFVGIEPSDTRDTYTLSEDRGSIKGKVSSETEPARGRTPNSAEPGARCSRSASGGSDKPIQTQGRPSETLDEFKARRLLYIDQQRLNDGPKFWQFWKPPAGGYTSPVPQGQDAADYMTKEAADKTPFWQRVKKSLPFVGGEELETLEYEQAHNADREVDADEEEAEWAKYLTKKDRPTHNLPLFGVNWLFGIPWVTKKVDTIYWCREELARLNVEIEEDQRHPERYPLLPSAFIQFEHQVAAHMACQSSIHHLPKHMAPRIIEISPKDVIWDNMAISWWQEWLRSGLVISLIITMVIFWAIPVAFTASLSQLDELIKQNKWLGFLKSTDSLQTAAEAVAGVLPAVLLALLLILVPMVLRLLAGVKGAKTGSQKNEFAQIFYFLFLFVQVFLIVSVASFFAASIDELFRNVSEKLNSVSAVLDLLATNLPKAANYFFTYMILQALSTSSGTLLQVGTLLKWYVVGRIMDSTPRSKWKRNTTLNTVNWGTFFPIYTNFACISIVYSVIAPLISIFAIITFSLLWLANRYSMLYVTRFEHDTGGVLYPRAINQTFTGIYFMELCIAGLFFIVDDADGKNPCTTHGVVMLVVLGLTILYQILLNRSFSPLFRYLPITIEDEAVLRDEAFQLAQNQRFGINDVDEEKGVGASGSYLAPLNSSHRNDDRDVAEHTDDEGKEDGEIEMGELRGRKHKQTSLLLNPVKQVGGWANAGGRQIRKITYTDSSAVEYRRKRHQRKLDAQRAIGDALYGGINDDIEDLTPVERDLLVRHAFKHSALRARLPVVWIPRDDLGISDDEIRRTQAYSRNIWISNEGTALDSKFRVVYGKNPPDFSEVDVINL
ncbi:calcium permeable stress-gated cation channel [Geosmithia morbida]|uniref:Calcium permeable stress-gated cation channel n=1 Tax=Geosmithia morbida TaxID=1094350 RepID=A0A9P5D8D2_9HYPO|nr:calcium permeable stress-gated cation channel [Geosmithia morbida]KAF4126665.1 calcium permeable stress-gated cation channel [Geosmithia morbida]